MVKMPYNLQQNITNPTDLLINVSTEVSIFAPIMLFFVWALITIGGFMANDKKTGKTSFFQWLVAGGFVTNIISLILFLIVGIISLEIVIVYLALFIGSVLLFFLTE